MNFSYIFPCLASQALAVDMEELRARDESLIASEIAANEYIDTDEYFFA